MKSILNLSRPTARKRPPKRCAPGDDHFVWSYRCPCLLPSPENLPSGVGIDKAGFEAVGQLSFRTEGGVGLAPIGPTARAQDGAALLGVSLIDVVLAPCWYCGRVTQTRVTTDSCWPPVKSNLVQCTWTTQINRLLAATRIQMG